MNKLDRAIASSSSFFNFIDVPAISNMRHGSSRGPVFLIKCYKLKN